MGLLVSRLWSKKTTTQILEELEKRIRSIEQYGYSTEQQRRRVVGTLMAFSIGVYVLAVILFYFYFPLTSWKDIFFYSTPLLVFPFVIVLLRAGLTRYYEWKLKKNKTKLIDMRAEKKKILEEVMDKETYKNAKQILEKFGEPKDTTLNYASAENNKNSIVPISKALVVSSPGQLRNRQTGAVMNASPMNSPHLMKSPAIPNMNMSTFSNQMTPYKKNQLPRPILPAGGGAFDRLVDYLVGDGPGSRYALVCKKCMGHNGMALPEEFEFLSYRCAYCQTLNPARKQKPIAPPLVSTPVRTPIKMKESSKSNSDSDCSIDEKKIDKVDSDTDSSIPHEENQNQIDDNLENNIAAKPNEAVQEEASAEKDE